MTAIDVQDEVIQITDDVVLLKLPYRDLLERAAVLEDFNTETLEEWIVWALLERSHWFACRTAGEDQLAEELAAAINQRWPMARAS